jgi:ABC-type sugar transport system ATPase subunit
VSEFILELKGIKKHFPGVQALDGVDFNVKPGEIHALVGENGAGKSTLVKIISGVFRPDSGEIFYKGKKTTIQDPRHAQELGIAAIHQEPSLYPDLSVLENIFMGRQPTKGPFGFIDWKTMRAEAEEVFRSIGVEIDLDAPAGSLSIAGQQLVQIAKAFSQKAQILIMDEPTSPLSQRETEALFNIVCKLRDQGIAIIYITHRLEEVFTLADRVTVLRDGKYMGTYPINELSYQFLISLMVGRTLSQLFPQEKVEIGAPILRVRGLTKKGRFYNINFELRRGEILGLAGLVGAGRSEVAHALFGIDPADEGEIEVDGRSMKIKSPWEALAAGIAYLPEDRHREGIIGPLKVRENISLAILDKLCKAGIISFQKERALAKEYVEKLDICTPSVEQLVMNLSGGTQQKVIIARWLASKPRILIMDEPTRGIDVATKPEIHRLMKQFAKEGMGILMISSELPEILGMSDRILVMREGRIVGELSREEATQERIMSLASGLA